jgi:FecR-like protein
MTRIQRRARTSRPTAISAMRRIIATLCCWSALLTIPAFGQIQHARITRISNTVTLSRIVGGNSIPVTLKVGDLLQLGDIIDTGTGTVVIRMDDGSQVTIYPNSRVRLNDFSNAGTWRDLLNVLGGRIRAKIYHAKRPNPYRVYSPIATIAVRGTDFLVIVEPNSETQVYVFEGLVEVSSTINPQKSVLVKPGGNIVVRPDGDISLIMSSPIRGLQVGSGAENNLRNTFDNRQSNYTGLPPSRYTAFKDSHLDSLLNPAYAAGFKQSTGRFYLIPTFSAKVSSHISGGGSLGSNDSAGETTSDYTLSSQTTYFTPLGSRFVVGGGAMVTRSGFGGYNTDRFFGPDDQLIDLKRYDGRTRFTTANLSLLAARRFGQAERTSLGIKLDYLDDQSSYSSNYSSDDAGISQPSYRGTATRAHRGGLTIGITQNFGEDKKLGVYYRYGNNSERESSIRSEYWSRVHFSDQLRGLEYDITQYSPAYERIIPRRGHSSDAGILFRGSATRRLFYGVEGSIHLERDRYEDHFPGSVSINNGPRGTEHYLENRRASGGIIGAGVGYALRERTVLSFDLSVGRTKRESHGQTTSSDLPEGVTILPSDPYYNERSTFRAWHIGGQTDIWRNLFAGGSLFFISENNRYFIASIDTNFEQQKFFTQEFSYYNNWNYKSKNLNVGWRIKPSWIVQYVYITTLRYAPSHSLMLRWEFGGGGKKQNND